ncbi:MAG: hypothetical protein AB7R40_23785 [Nitrospiraceae bacterium]
MRYRSPRKHDGDHLDFIRQLPCLCCGNNIETEAAHVRYSERMVCKRPTGMGEKPDDAFAVPLCGRCHRDQHGMNEREFWRMQGIDPIKVALALYYWSGDADACAVILTAARDQSAMALSGDIR